MKKRMLAMIMCLMIPASCGYHFAGTGDAVDPAIRSVYVSSFVNATPEPLVETYVRNAFFVQFRRSGRFTIAASADEADAVLWGSVADIRTARATYTAGESAVEDRVTMRLEVTFEDSGGEVVWSQSNISGSETYPVSGDSSATERNRTAALRKLSDDLADRAYRNMITGF